MVPAWRELLDRPKNGNLWPWWRSSVPWHGCSNGTNLGNAYYIIYLSIYLFIYLSTYLSIYPSIYLSIYPSIYLSYPILSYPIPSHPIPSDPIRSDPILSYPILSHPSIYLSIYLSINFAIATKPSRLCHFWQGAESIAPATQNHTQTSKTGPRPSVSDTLDFQICSAPPKACTFWTSQFPKVLRGWNVFNILTSKFSSRHSGAHLFHISTSKSGLRLRCFWHLTSACASHHSRVHFWASHLNFQKCSDNDMFLVFWLGNFASGHNGVHFLNISTSKLSPRMRRFEHFDFQMCFAPQRRARFDLSSHHMVPRPPL